MSKSIIKQVAHVCIFAHDIAETSEWYQRVLGLEIRFKFSRAEEFFGFYLDAGNRTFIEVFQKDSARFSETDRINHICLEVENMDAALAHIRAQNVDVTEKSMGCDDTWQSWITDPNGTKIELFEYTSKSAQFVGGDRVADW